MAERHGNFDANVNNCASRNDGGMLAVISALLHFPSQSFLKISSGCLIAAGNLIIPFCELIFHPRKRLHGFS
jgi:hypothetical protein